MPEYPSDPANQQRWTEEWKARSVVHDKYFAEANALLGASIERRGRARFIRWWYDATRLNRTQPVAADVLSRLESKYSQRYLKF
jgi:hypothetical protein